MTRTYEQRIHDIHARGFNISTRSRPYDILGTVGESCTVGIDMTNPRRGWSRNVIIPGSETPEVKDWWRQDNLNWFLIDIAPHDPALAALWKKELATLDRELAEEHRAIVNAHRMPS